MINRKNQLIAFGLSALLYTVPVSAFAENSDDKDVSEKKTTITAIDKTDKNNSNSEEINDIEQSDNNSDLNAENKTQDSKNEWEKSSVKEENDDNTYNVGWVKNSDGTYNLYDGLGDMVNSSW